MSIEDKTKKTIDEAMKKGNKLKDEAMKKGEELKQKAKEMSLDKESLSKEANKVKETATEKFKEIKGSKKKMTMVGGAIVFILIVLTLLFSCSGESMNADKFKAMFNNDPAHNMNYIFSEKNPKYDVEYTTVDVVTGKKYETPQELTHILKMKDKNSDEYYVQHGDTTKALPNYVEKVIFKSDAKYMGKTYPFAYEIHVKQKPALFKGTTCEEEFYVVAWDDSDDVVTLLTKDSATGKMKNYKDTVIIFNKNVKGGKELPTMTSK